MGLPRLSVLFFACASLALGIALPAPAQSRGGGYAWDEPGWRFRLHDRPIKVALLAGSIGAFQDQPYARLLHDWCPNVEIRNLSRVGYGASQLYFRFRDEIIDNPRTPFGQDGIELWLMWNGGLNSVGNGYRTNHYIRRAFRDAHRRGMRVVGLTLTPWGALSDSRRWGGARGLDTLRSTRQIVDFVMARSTPRDALGRYAEMRDVAPDAPWTQAEKADIRIDLFDSPLRDRDAAPRDFDEMRRTLARDSRWRREVEELGEGPREARLAADAALLASLPSFFLRGEYRGFDPIHPNREGHEAIAATVCPRLPPSWGCICP